MLQDLLAAGHQTFWNRFEILQTGITRSVIERVSDQRGKQPLVSDVLAFDTTQEP